MLWPNVCASISVKPGRGLGGGGGDGWAQAGIDSSHLPSSTGTFDYCTGLSDKCSMMVSDSVGHSQMPCSAKLGSNVQSRVRRAVIGQ